MSANLVPIKLLENGVVRLEDGLSLSQSHCATQVTRVVFWHVDDNWVVGKRINLSCMGILWIKRKYTDRAPMEHLWSRTRNT